MKSLLEFGNVSVELRTRGDGTVPAEHSQGPMQPLTLCSSVASFVDATNKGDIDALMSTFVDDALVNDQLTDHWGRAAIREWACRDVIDVHMTLKVVRAVRHYNHMIIDTHADGFFDKRGLSDPFIITLYFSIVKNKTVQLIILQNNPSIYLLQRNDQPPSCGYFVSYGASDTREVT